MMPLIFQCVLITVVSFMITFASLNQVHATIAESGKRTIEVSLGENSYDIAFRSSGLNVKSMAYNGDASMTISVETLPGDLERSIELELPREFVRTGLTGLPPLISSVKDPISPDDVPGGMGVFAFGENVRTVAQTNVYSSGCTDKVVLEIRVPEGTQSIVLNNLHPLLGIAPMLALSTDPCLHQLGEDVLLRMSYNNSSPDSATVELSVNSTDGRTVSQSTIEMEPNTSLTTRLDIEKSGHYIASARVVSSDLTAQTHFIVAGNPMSFPVAIEENEFVIGVEGDPVPTGIVFSRIAKSIHVEVLDSQNRSGVMHISVPSDLLGGNLSAIGSENIADVEFSVIESDQTNNVVEVGYTKQGSGSASFVVLGTRAIPEFPIGLVIPLILGLTTGFFIILSRIYPSRFRL